MFYKQTLLTTAAITNSNSNPQKKLFVNFLRDVYKIHSDQQIANCFIFFATDQNIQHIIILKIRKYNTVELLICQNSIYTLQ